MNIDRTNLRTMIELLLLCTLVAGYFHYQGMSEKGLNTKKDYTVFVLRTLGTVSLFVFIPLVFFILIQFVFD